MNSKVKMNSLKIALSSYLILQLSFSTPFAISLIKTNPSSNKQFQQGSTYNEIFSVRTTTEGTENKAFVAELDSKNGVSETFQTVKKSVTVCGSADILALNKSIFQFKSKFNITASEKIDCFDLNGSKKLTPTKLINLLTASCRYDRLERPLSYSEPKSALTVYVRVFINIMQCPNTGDKCFKISGILQFRYIDPRLAYEEYNLNGNQPIRSAANLSSRIWVPGIFLVDKLYTNILELPGKDILTEIYSDGTVTISSKIKGTLDCNANLKTFPFDTEECSTSLESWVYNASDVKLSWEKISPVTLNPNMKLEAYTVEKLSSEESVIYGGVGDTRHGFIAGNYSSLKVTAVLTRELSPYLMTYFLPSMMIVAISWVSFWLQPDQTPARTMLGTSTMLSFITLASSHRTMPTYKYVKFSEIWFLSCTLFILGSLIEFAFVNTIWRRKRNLESKKINSKCVFKSTLTPKFKIQEGDQFTNKAKLGKSLVTECSVNNSGIFIESNNVDLVNIPSINKKRNQIDYGQNEFLVMTPNQIALWIDRKARFVFPLAFITFNGIFWSLFYS